MISDSTIVFSNVVPAALFDVETPRDEFGSLERLLAREEEAAIAEEDFEGAGLARAQRDAGR